MHLRRFMLYTARSVLPRSQRIEVNKDVNFFEVNKDANFFTSLLDA